LCRAPPLFRQNRYRKMIFRHNYAEIDSILAASLSDTGIFNPDSTQTIILCADLVLFFGEYFRSNFWNKPIHCAVYYRQQRIADCLFICTNPHGNYAVNSKWQATVSSCLLYDKQFTNCAEISPLIRSGRQRCFAGFCGDKQFTNCTEISQDF